MAGRKERRKWLVIRCAGRAVDSLKFRAVGPECGTVFASPVYRDDADWIQQARVGGWRVSPPAADGTVDAFCPKCCGGTAR